MAKEYTLENTALITLLARARASKDPSMKFNDPWAEEIVEKLKSEGVENFNFEKAYPGIMTREKWFDLMLTDEIQKHPAGLSIVNLGAGVDGRPYRLDNPHINWYDVDLPEGINTRRQFYKEGPRHVFITSDITDPKLWEEHKITKPVVFMASGVFMYLTLEKLNQALSLIAEHYEGSSIYFDVNSPWFAKNYHKISPTMPKGCFGGWGVELNSTPEDIQTLLPNLDNITFGNNFDIAAEKIPEIGRPPFLFRIILAMGLKKKLFSGYISAKLRRN